MCVGGDNMPRDSASQFCPQPIIQLHVKTRKISIKRWGDSKAAQLAVGSVSESPKENEEFPTKYRTVQQADLTTIRPHTPQEPRMFESLKADRER